jgi:hypothetical protein
LLAIRVGWYHRGVGLQGLAVLYGGKMGTLVLFYSARDTLLYNYLSCRLAFFETWH